MDDLDIVTEESEEALKKVHEDPTYENIRRAAEASIKRYDVQDNYRISKKLLLEE